MKSVYINYSTKFSSLNPIKYNLQGTWSRKINEEHRIVYEIPDEGVLLIYSLKGHYTDLDI